VSRPGWQLRDAALGYASRDIPVLPLHYPLPHHRGIQPVTDDGQLTHPAVGTGCSCRDPSCGQVAKHPLGALVPHGLKDATTNRARVLAWWTQQPQANIGLATGYRFDVLDIDGPFGAKAMRTFAGAHALHSSGPLVRTGGGGWHYYLAPTGLGNVGPRDLEQVDWRGRGGYVVAPPSRHRSGHPYQWVAGRHLDTALPDVPAALLQRLQHRQGRPTCPGRLHPGGRPARTWLWAGGTRSRAGSGRRRPPRSPQPAAVGSRPQPLQPGRHRRPRPPAGPPRSAPGRRTLRPAG
jgi:Bifunctional DNA primase/polymerase, N-terminal